MGAIGLEVARNIDALMDPLAVPSFGAPLGHTIAAIAFACKTSPTRLTFKSFFQSAMGRIMECALAIGVQWELGPLAGPKCVLDLLKIETV